jgi:hypothetical protein
VEPALAFRGFILGFTIAAAVGPISLLVIRRTLAEGRVVGLTSGLGVATADGTYGAIAAFGLGRSQVAGGRARPRAGGGDLPALARLDHGSRRTARPPPHRPAGRAGQLLLSILGLT